MEIVASHLPLCVSTGTYHAELAVSNMLSLACGYVVPLSRMQSQQTLSRLPIEVEGHNCRLVLAGHTDYRRGVLLPSRLRSVTNEKNFGGGQVDPRVAYRHIFSFDL